MDLIQDQPGQFTRCPAARPQTGTSVSEVHTRGMKIAANSTTPPANTGLHVTVTGCSEDLGVATSLAKTLTYYAAKSGDTTAVQPPAGS